MLRHLLLLAAFSMYIADAIDVIERNAIAVPEVDWAAIRNRALDDARTASTQADAYAVIRRTLHALQDSHSFLMEPDQATTLRTIDWPPDRATSDGSVAKIALRGFAGTNRDAMHRYVRTLREDLAKLPACGYVVDLRENIGGNMWPQLLALQPILGTGAVGAFRTRAETGAWTLGVSDARAGDDVAIGVTDPLPALDASGKPVAVLLSPDTASSGEAVAIAFAGRNNTRSFGWHTRGATTGNIGVPLADGALLMVAATIMLDRDGRAHRPYVRPDEQTTADRRVRGVDVTFDAARAWLRTAHGC